MMEKEIFEQRGGAVSLNDADILGQHPSIGAIRIINRAFVVMASILLGP